jgi:hypothetical protein
MKNSFSQSIDNWVKKVQSQLALLQSMDSKVLTDDNVQVLQEAGIPIDQLLKNLADQKKKP